jgi:NAD(P)-dependent dehydrogenase (short-subunit alcohol dehydrogenase family)
MARQESGAGSGPDRAGRVALITGAARGLGYEIARQLAVRGMHVVIGARDRGRAAGAADELGKAGLPASAVPLDVADPDSVPAAVAEVVGSYGRLDVLVNNAGVALDAGQEAHLADFEIVDRTFAVNLVGAWRCCAEAVPHMRRQRYGRIVNLSSRLASLHAMSVGEPAYRVSKTGLNALTRILAAELAGTGILVNAASPGWVRTVMGGPRAPRSVSTGARTPVWLATLPDDGPTGGFWADNEPMPW